MKPTRELEILCSQCGATELCGPQQMMARLRTVGLLKREAKPEVEFLVELFSRSAAKFACACGAVGMQVRQPTQEDWNVRRTCEVCGQAIPAERLEALPHATRCANCASQPKGQNEEVEYCPRCGEPMSVRLSRGPGVSRYTMTCPKCKR